MSVIAATGHRPDKLGGYGQDVSDKLFLVALRYLRGFDGPIYAGISGMALGWDTAWAKALLAMEIPLIAAVPFIGQDNAWPDASREMYRKILAHASQVEVVSEGGYSPKKMQIRNEWMIDNCTRVAALWNGTPGGTFNCLKYVGNTKPIDNLWDEWVHV